MPIELKVKKGLVVEEGRHDATISRIEERHEPYHYVDVYMKLDDVDVELKYGCPANVSENSKLGKLLAEVGVVLEVDTLLDVEKALQGKRVSLMTINEKVPNKGTFARIVEGSVKLLSS